MALVSLGLVLSPVGEPLGFVRPPAAVLAGLAAITTGYVLTTELTKPPFYRRIGD